MRKFDIVKKYLKFVPDFDIYKYCPSYFGLDDIDCSKYTNREEICKTCWEQESEEDNEKLLEFIGRLYRDNIKEVKKLHEKESELLKAMQELCPHKNTYKYNNNEYMPWFDEDEKDKIITKCKDCGKILK